jgi:hypothetical protein
MRIRVSKEAHLCRLTEHLSVLVLIHLTPLLKKEAVDVNVSLVPQVLYVWSLLSHAHLSALERLKVVSNKANALSVHAQNIIPECTHNANAKSTKRRMKILPSQCA